VGGKAWGVLCWKGWYKRVPYFIVGTMIVSILLCRKVTYTVITPRGSTVRHGDPSLGAVPACRLSQFGTVVGNCWESILP